MDRNYNLTALDNRQIPIPKHLVRAESLDEAEVRFGDDDGVQERGESRGAADKAVDDS